MPKTFYEWLDTVNEVLARPVVGIGPVPYPDGSVGFKFLTPEKQVGTSSPIVKLTNLNQMDEKGRTQWEVKTANHVYIVSMDNATARKLATTWRLRGQNGMR